MNPLEGNPNSQKILLFGAVGILVFLFIIFIVITQFSRNSTTASNAIASVTPEAQSNAGSSAYLNSNVSPTKEIIQNNATASTYGYEVKKATKPAAAPSVFMKVGDENLYGIDLDTELAAYPEIGDYESNRQEAITKMISDSIALQAGAKEGYVKLDSSIFNSANKDYVKRTIAVDQVRKGVGSNKISGISGSIIAVWFYNDGEGAVGYEKGKEIALAKINAVYQEVKAGRMTMEQAGDTIAKDTSLAEVDEAYETNAFRIFRASSKDQKISIDPDFDAQLWKLKKGEMTPVTVGTDYDRRSPDAMASNAKIPALYRFGKVTGINTSPISSFEDWIKSVKNSYEILSY